MSIEGVLPKLDAAVFADTQWEPKAVYEHLGKLATLAASKGIPVIQATKGNIRADALLSQVRGKKTDGVRFASMPMYTDNPDGSVGMINRQCTREYKLDVINREVRKIAGLRRGQRVTELLVEQWIGISSDEASRMRDSGKRWMRNRYPLCFDFNPAMNRQDCILWLKRHSYPVPKKSACLGCPFHSDFEWRQIKEDEFEWADVTEFDDLIRDCGGMEGKVYLHKSCKPLREIDFSTKEERGQTNWINECTGMCGV